MKWRGLALLILLVWGVGKICWENQLSHERNRIMGGSEVLINYQLRDYLGQGLTMAALGGFRSLAADGLWVSVIMAWQEQTWERLFVLEKLCVLLQPRSAFYWDMGAWNLAWNASSAVSISGNQGTTSMRQNYDSMRWIVEGQRFLERGIQVNPNQAVLYQRLGDLYWQRLGDYEKAADCYCRALACPGAPIYLERFVGLALEKAREDRQAYEYWRCLWRSFDKHEIGVHRWDVVTRHIRQLEEKLGIPDRDSFFGSNCES